MDHLARCAFVQAQAACLLAHLAAMQAENESRKVQGLSPAYGEKEFLALQDTYLVGHNAVIEYLR